MGISLEIPQYSKTRATIWSCWTTSGHMCEGM
jgi:hypothetical protein